MNLASRAAFVVLAALVFGSSIGVVWARHQTRSQFVQLQQLTSERDALEVEWGQLKLEQSAFATHGRVEQTARGNLQMVIPRPEEVRIVKP
ncbi:MAG TPA: cell division protein FtsL [Steroidobacteraceae bacterium]|jgi:cell division protein FtsL|nr:cell division protein FtsL [Steroidobacteraceae bacterium]